MHYCCDAQTLTSIQYLETNQYLISCLVPQGKIDEDWEHHIFDFLVKDEYSKVCLLCVKHNKYMYI